MQAAKQLCVAGARCSYIYIYSCTLHQPRDVPIGLGGFVFALQGLGRWGGWNVGLRAVLGLLFNPLPFAVDVIPIIAFPIVVFPIRTGSFFQFSRVGYFRLPVLERKAKSEAWFYEGIAMLVRISDTPFFIDDAVNAFLPVSYTHLTLPTN